MNTTLVRARTNEFYLDCHSKSAFPEENMVVGYNFSPGLDEYSLLSNGEIISQDISVPITHSSPIENLTVSDATITFISQMLMEEEDLAKKQCVFRACLALQATEKLLFDALNNNHLDEDALSHYFTKLCSCSSSDSSPNEFDNFTETCGCRSSGRSSDVGSFVVESNLNRVQDGEITQFLLNDKLLKRGTAGYEEMGEMDKRDCFPNNLREKRNRSLEDGVHTDHDPQRSNKQLANNIGESESLEMYDKVLLCPNSDFLRSSCGEADEVDAKIQLRKRQSKGKSSGRPRKGTKQGITTEVVDIRGLLMQCAQAVANYDNRNASDILMRIRQHSSTHGDGTERLVHYFANALEVRMAGSGTESYEGSFSSRISADEILKSYKTYITACPFTKMSNLLANRTIERLAIGATTLHIIDFGILYGFQWPCLIQSISERPGGPPKLRITGIDFPQPGFCPAERVVDTGNRLRKYSERFGVPFEYSAIAQKWETIKIEDLKIEKNELLVVNSMYRLQNVPGETVTASSPRDEVLNLVKKINPRIFIQGIINGTYNTPFFITRFREVFYYLSSMFDMFDATVPRENEHRVLFEKEILGTDAMNVIACEGTERVNRPETHRQWQVRNVRAGFRKLELDQELVKYVRGKVKMDYHKDFSVDEDGKWMLQGWKGRVTHALSCWQPTN